MKQYIYVTSLWQLDQIRAEGLTEQNEKNLQICTSIDIGIEGWICVGEAECTVTLHPQTEILQNAVECLEKKIQEVRGEAQTKVTYLQDAIQKLLSIGHSSPAVVDDDIPL